MQVTVFGASGNIGRHVTRQLLDVGHDVIAYVRSPDKLALSGPRLSVRTGELTDSDGVRGALRGSDATISALGPTLKPFATGTPLTEGTRLIVDGMHEHCLHRFIGLATPSVVDPRDQSHWKHTVLPIMAGTMFPNALKEVRGMTELITASDLEWTIARITNPTNKPATGRIRAGFLGHDHVGSAMSRADIAAFLVSQLTDRTYIRSAPAISN